MELHRAIAGEYHHLVGCDFGHTTGNLGVLVQRLIPHYRRPVVDKGPRIFHAHINVHGGMLEGLIRANQFAKLLSCLEVLGNASEAFVGGARGFSCSQQSTQEQRIPDCHRHRVTADHFGGRHAREVDIRRTLGQVDQHIL